MTQTKKNTIIVPNNVKVFVITYSIDKIYNIIFENTLTEKVVITDDDLDYYKQYMEIYKYLPLEYHEFYTESFQLK